METTGPPETEEATAAGIFYVLKEEEQLAKIWSPQDRAKHVRGVWENVELVGNSRQRLEKLRVRTDSIWERFVTLTLERAYSEQLREFLDGMDLETQESSQEWVEVDCEIDRLRVRVREQRRWLGEKIAILEPLAHRTSTQNHLSMMLSRVEGLEAYLLGKKDVALEAYDMHYKRHTNASSDLLYLRVRLLTTRIAAIASNLSRQLSELDAELAALLPDIEQLKTDLAGVTARIECVSELSRYWLRYLDITVPERGT